MLTVKEVGLEQRSAKLLAFGLTLYQKEIVSCKWESNYQASWRLSAMVFSNGRSNLLSMEADLEETFEEESNLKQ